MRERQVAACWGRSYSCDVQLLSGSDLTEPSQLRESLQERLVSYTIEWCETPSARRPGCAYVDTSVSYEAGSEKHPSHVVRGSFVYGGGC